MPKKKRGFLFIILGFILVIIGIVIVFLFRENQKKHFDELYNSPKILSVDYGIVPQKDMFMEKNSLFPKIEQENYYYLHITDDYTLFTYYLDWYYTFDPLKGYNLVKEIKLDKDLVTNIMNDIKVKERDNLTATIESEYVVLHHSNKQTYIKKEELQSIFQSYDLLLNI